MSAGLETPPASPPEATVIDLGVGNLGNLARALSSVGAVPEITADPERVARSRCLLLPGVGAFSPPREALRGALEEALREALDGGAWLLGICVGYQLLFQTGEEFGEHDGLGLLAGRVTRLPETVPLPHIGWNRLHPIAVGGLLQGVRAGEFFYFVHSFAPSSTRSAQVQATALHGRSFAAVAGCGRVWGTQFHPEKSGPAGLKLLFNFLEMTRGASAVD